MHTQLYVTDEFELPGLGLVYKFYSVALARNARDGTQNIREVNLHVFLSNAQKWLMVNIIVMSLCTSVISS